jgi:hypothetical protein
MFGSSPRDSTEQSDRPGTLWTWGGNSSVGNADFARLTAGGFQGLSEPRANAVSLVRLAHLSAFTDEDI